MADWIASCHDLRGRLPDDLLVLPAHNEPLTGLHHRLTSLIDNHETALARLADHIAEAPRRVVDCFSPLFKRPIGGEVLGMATGEALAHLNCLIGRGLAMREADASGIWWFRRAG